MSKTYSKTRTLVECALMIALGTVLANIKIFEMPNGGSITLLSMLTSQISLIGSSSYRLMKPSISSGV